MRVFHEFLRIAVFHLETLDNHLERCYNSNMRYRWYLADERRGKEMTQNLSEMRQNISRLIQEKANGRQFDTDELEQEYGRRFEKIHNYEEIAKVLAVFVKNQPVTGRKLNKRESTSSTPSTYWWMKA